MTKKHSIRQRIYLLFAGFTLFTCISYSMLLLGYSWVVEDNVFNRIVSDEAHYIEDQFAATSSVLEPRHAFLSLYENWQSLPKPIYQQHLVDTDQIEFSTPDGGTIHLRPIPLGTETYVLVADVTAFEVGGEYLPYVTVSLLLVLGAFSALAIAAAWPVARAASAPLVALKEQVEAIDASDVQPGFSATFPNNEIGYLASEIERSMLRIQKTLKRETNFTRDVSHELRTPVTVLKNLASQIERETPLSDKQLTQLTGSVRNLEQTLDTLLALAREESQAFENLLFLNVLEDCIINHAELSANEDFQLRIDVPATLTVSANRNLLTLLINNLLGNALTHASSNQLEICATGGEIIFRNATDTQNDPNPLADGAKARDSRGLGLGLYLVQRICTVFNWQISTEATNGTFAIHLLYAVD